MAGRERNELCCALEVCTQAENETSSAVHSSCALELCCAFELCTHPQTGESRLLLVRTIAPATAMYRAGVSLST